MLGSNSEGIEKNFLISVVSILVGSGMNQVQLQDHQLKSKDYELVHHQDKIQSHE